MVDEIIEITNELEMMKFEPYNVIKQYKERIVPGGGRTRDFHRERVAS
jgi:hypothetical protein